MINVDDTLFLAKEDNIKYIFISSIHSIRIRNLQWIVLKKTTWVSWI